MNLDFASGVTTASVHGGTPMALSKFDVSGGISTDAARSQTIGSASRSQDQGPSL